MPEINDFKLYSVHDLRQPPLVLHLKDNASGKQLILMCCQLYRGGSRARDQRAQVLVDWARKQSLPVIAIGDFCMEYDLSDKKGSEAFSIMQRDGIFEWIKPATLVDTQWVDQNGDGKEDSDSIVDFVFTAGPAKDWDISTKVIVREGDFPDDERTSDHRPTLTTVIVK